MNLIFFPLLTLTRQSLRTLGAVILIQGPEAGHPGGQHLARLSVQDEDVLHLVLLRQPRVGLNVGRERLGGHHNHPGLGVHQLGPDDNMMS